MRGSAAIAWMLDVRDRRASFRFEIVCQDLPLEMKLESAPEFSHSEIRAVHGPFCGMTFENILSLSSLSTTSVAAFRDLNSYSRNGVCFAISRYARDIIALGAPHSRAVFLCIRPNPSSKGERCIKDTVHPIVHFSVHLRISRRIRSRRSCANRDGQFGRGQNTELGWSDPTFVHVSVPKEIRGVAPAQLRGDRAACFVRAVFRNRGPQR